MHTTDILGYVGGLCLLYAYFELSHGRWTGRSVAYQLMNLLAGVLLTAYSVVKHAPATVALNGIFSMIALYGMYKALHPVKTPKRRSKRP